MPVWKSRLIAPPPEFAVRTRGTSAEDLGRNVSARNADAPGSRFAGIGKGLRDLRRRDQERRAFRRLLLWPQFQPAQYLSGEKGWTGNQQPSLPQ